MSGQTSDRNSRTTNHKRSSPSMMGPPNNQSSSQDPLDFEKRDPASDPEPDPPLSSNSEQIQEEPIAQDPKSNKDERALSEFQISMVYNELRRLAASRLNHFSPNDSLHATALVHEAYLRLLKASIGPDSEIWTDREAFFAAAAEAMRRVVIDYYRSKKSQKRGGQVKRIHADIDSVDASLPDVDVLALNDALELLQREHPEKAQLVKMRAFGGMSMEECAAALNVSSATAGRHWRYARAWLAAKLQE